MVWRSWELFPSEESCSRKEKDLQKLFNQKTKQFEKTVKFTRKYPAQPSKQANTLSLNPIKANGFATTELSARDTTLP